MIIISHLIDRLKAFKDAGLYHAAFGLEDVDEVIMLLEGANLMRRSLTVTLNVTPDGSYESVGLMNEDMMLRGINLFDEATK